MTRPVAHAPLLAAITVDPTGGGVAAVSRLLWHVLRSEWGARAQFVRMFDHENRPATTVEKARFTMAVSQAQAFARTDWVLFAHLGLAQVQNALPAWLRRPYGVFLHGIEAWKPLSSAEQRALAGADLRLANSQYTAARVMERHPTVGPIVPCPLALCPPATAADSQGATTAELPALGDRVALVVGRMSSAEQYKGHDQLIEAWPQVVACVPSAQLVIVGDGDDAPRLKRKAADNGVGPNVVFTGFVDKAGLEALYRRAALFALPSRGEGFGLVYLEAMSHRLACVGSVHDAAREVIVDGETGRIVRQDDIEGLADTLAALLLDAPLRKRMGDAGYTRVMTEFTVDRFSDRLCGLLPASLPAASSF